ncbi:Alpha/Beta hydrolase protein [Mucidula mucida]|nr:Alpha/Beta hydrolase protein [Mucidula mucida]
MIPFLPVALQALLSGVLWKESTSPSLTFRLRHTHAIFNGSRNLFSDLPATLIADTDAYSLQTRLTTVHKPSSWQNYMDSRFLPVSESSLWQQSSIPGPDVEKRETLLQLAKMTFNTYYEPNSTQWYDLGPDWNTTFSYGWEPDADGFRGHVFVSEDESTVVVSIKGTSVPWLGGGPTVVKDKLNDNLLFSCCCARVGPTWSTVCGCYDGRSRCKQDCVETALEEESLFYPIGTNLYNNISYMYPEANIWMIGHSLGGSLASLVGQTFGVPVVAFEAPADRLASRRLHLPSPPSTQHITHVFNTGDPIPMGTCTGVASTCAGAGYALESRCHVGKIIKYDTVKKLGWRVNVQNHPINVVIDLLSREEDWEGARQVPQAVDEDEDCVDCFQWEYI